MINCTQVLDEEDDKDVPHIGRIKVGSLEITKVNYDIFTGENVIGRDQLSDIVISNASISTKHAVIEVEDWETHFILDCGSTNKTRLGKVILKPNARYELKERNDIMFADLPAKYTKLPRPQNVPDNDDSGSETGSESMLNCDAVNEECDIIEESPKKNVPFRTSGVNKNRSVSLYVNESSIFEEKKINGSATKCQVVETSMDDSTDDEDFFVLPSQSVKEFNISRQDTSKNNKDANLPLTEDVFGCLERKATEIDHSKDIFEMETQEPDPNNKPDDSGNAPYDMDSQSVFNIDNQVTNIQNSNFKKSNTHNIETTPLTKSDLSDNRNELKKLLTEDLFEADTELFDEESHMNISTGKEKKGSETNLSEAETELYDQGGIAKTNHCKEEGRSNVNLSEAETELNNYDMLNNKLNKENGEVCVSKNKTDLNNKAVLRKGKGRGKKKDDKVEFCDDGKKLNYSKINKRDKDINNEIDKDGSSECETQVNHHLLITEKNNELTEGDKTHSKLNEKASIYCNQVRQDFLPNDENIDEAMSSSDDLTQVNHHLVSDPTTCSGASHVKDNINDKDVVSKRDSSLTSGIEHNLVDIDNDESNELTQVNSFLKKEVIRLTPPILVKSEDSIINISVKEECNSNEDAWENLATQINVNLIDKESNLIQSKPLQANFEHKNNKTIVDLNETKHSQNADFYNCATQAYIHDQTMKKENNCKGDFGNKTSDCSAPSKIIINLVPKVESSEFHCVNNESESRTITKPVDVEGMQHLQVENPASKVSKRKKEVKSKHTPYCTEEIKNNSTVKNTSNLVQNDIAKLQKPESQDSSSKVADICLFEKRENFNDELVNEGVTTVSTVTTADMEICSTVDDNLYESTQSVSESSKKNQSKLNISSNKFTLLKSKTQLNVVNVDTSNSLKSRKRTKLFENIKDVGLSNISTKNDFTGPCSSSTPFKNNNDLNNSEQVLSRTPIKTNSTVLYDSPVLPSSEELKAVADKTPEKPDDSQSQLNIKSTLPLALNRTPRIRKQSTKIADYAKDKTNNESNTYKKMKTNSCSKNCNDLQNTSNELNVKDVNKSNDETNLELKNKSLRSKGYSDNTIDSVENKIKTSVNNEDSNMTHNKVSEADKNKSNIFIKSNDEKTTRPTIVKLQNILSNDPQIINGDNSKTKSNRRKYKELPKSEPLSNEHRTIYEDNAVCLKKKKLSKEPKTLENLHQENNDPEGSSLSKEKLQHFDEHVTVQKNIITCATTYSVSAAKYCATEMTELKKTSPTNSIPIIPSIIKLSVQPIEISNTKVSQKDDTSSSKTLRRANEHSNVKNKCPERTLDQPLKENDDVKRPKRKCNEMYLKKQIVNKKEGEDLSNSDFKSPKRSRRGRNIKGEKSLPKVEDKQNITEPLRTDGDCTNKTNQLKTTNSFKEKSVLMENKSKRKLNINVLKDENSPKNVNDINKKHKVVHDHNLDDSLDISLTDTGNSLSTPTTSKTRRTRKNNLFQENKSNLSSEKIINKRNIKDKNIETSKDLEPLQPSYKENDVTTNNKSLFSVPSKTISRQSKKNSESNEGTEVSNNKNTPIRKKGGSRSVSTSSQDSDTRTSTPRRLSVKRGEQVLFTGLNDPLLESNINKLGGKVVDCPSKCSVLVTDKVRRTVKFLCALGQGKPIVKPEWITQSWLCTRFEDPMKYLLKDTEAEKKFKFRLSQTLQEAKKRPLLSGYSIHATASVKPPPDDIKTIIESCGGVYLDKIPSRWPDQSLAVSHLDDKSLWKKLKVKGTTPPIVAAEMILLGVLQNKLDLETHRIQ